MKRRYSSWILALSLMAANVPEARAADTKKAIADGIELVTRKTSKPEVVHMLVVDLGGPGVHLGSTKSSERKRTTSSYAKLVGAAAAVNGDFFSFSTYSTSGLAAGGGAAWAGTKDNASTGTIAFDGAKRVELSDASKIVTFDATWMKGIVSGHPQIVNAGTALAKNPSTAACGTPNPRTAMGISKDHKTLYVAVVDGRSKASAGMTCTELAALMKGFGADDAVNLDGGGSSTMYLRGSGVVNVPSDGSERVVANHLAVFAPKLGTVGSVHGIVYAEPDKSKPLETASVALADGVTDTTDATGAYALETLPGKVAVTAKKPGYASQTIDVDVAAGADVELDIALARDPSGDSDSDSDGGSEAPGASDAPEAETNASEAAPDGADGDDGQDGCTLAGSRGARDRWIGFMLASLVTAAAIGRVRRRHGAPRR